MKKRTMKQICVHLVKFMFFILPMVFLFVAYWIPDSDSVTPVYQYTTNEVSSFDDLVVGNIYHFKFDCDRSVATNISFSVIIYASHNFLNFIPTKAAFLFLAKMQFPFCMLW